ncbi:MAG: carbon-nitrogen hydrolase family protein, partial [Planctomycetes bacterium]|nr:carbon-nitrogen hydrolase family protein [Planctomycetota bacterium]
MSFRAGNTMLLVLGLSACCWTTSLQAQADEASPTADGWAAHSPRDEIRPTFSSRPDGGRDGKGSLIIEADEREGRMGWWQKTFSVQGGKTYRFTVFRKATGVDVPRRTAVARILWRDANGAPVLRDQPTWASYRPGSRPRAEPEFPLDRATGSDGWTEVTGDYRAPADAAQAIVELGYRWAPAGRVEWSQCSWTETSEIPPRKAKLAAIHFQPREGRTNAEKCRLFAPLIAVAA